jgi:hypothetical protein
MFGDMGKAASYVEKMLAKLLNSQNIQWTETRTIVDYKRWRRDGGITEMEEEFSPMTVADCPCESMSLEKRETWADYQPRDLNK